MMDIVVEISEHRVETAANDVNMTIVVVIAVDRFIK